MKKAVALIFVLILFAFSACTAAPPIEETETPPADPPAAEQEENMKIEIVIGAQTFTAELCENETAKAWLSLLPQTLDMSELNGNEKYYYMDAALPTDPSVPDGIRAGDLMLYGNDCLVLFYKSFSTSYSYTPLGKLDDPEGLAAALGAGDVQITFKKAS